MAFYITQIMKAELQYMDVHWLPVTHFTFINNGGLMVGMTCRLTLFSLNCMRT